MATKMPTVSACEQESCSYNKKKACHAMAITVGDNQHHPMCDTVLMANHKGGVTAPGQVGACKEGECKFNMDFECTAKSIQVGIHEGCADCITYAAR